MRVLLLALFLSFSGIALAGSDLAPVKKEEGVLLANKTKNVCGKANSCKMKKGKKGAAEYCGCKGVKGHAPETCCKPVEEAPVVAPEDDSKMEEDME